MPSLVSFRGLPVKVKVSDEHPRLSYGRPFPPPLHPCCFTLGKLGQAPAMGNFRKYPYTTTDGFNILTPPCLRKFQNALPPHALGIPLSLTPPPVRIFPFFFKSFTIPGRVRKINVPNLAYFTSNYFK